MLSLSMVEIGQVEPAETGLVATLRRGAKRRSENHNEKFRNQPSFD